MKNSSQTGKIMYLTNSNIEEYLTKTNFQKRIDKLAKKYKNKKIMIYGASGAFDIITRKFDLSAINIIGIADKKFNDNGEQAGYNAYTPYTFLNASPDVVLIAMIESEIAECFFEDTLIPEFGYFKYEPLILKKSSKKNIKIFFNNLKYYLASGEKRFSPSKPKVYPDVKNYIEENSNIDINYKIIFPKTTEKKEDFILNIPDGKIWGNDGVVLTHDNCLIKELMIFSEKTEGSLSKHPLFNKSVISKISNKTYHNENVAVLSARWSNCYYHWVLEVLPKLLLLEKSGIKIQKYVINNLIHKFQHEYLKLLDIPMSKVEIINNKTLIHAKNLIVPSFPGTSGNPPLWACDFLKEKLTKYIDKSKTYPEKIFISREKARERRIVNTDAIIKILEEKGFTKIILEELDLKEQISIFNNAKVIISPHGAGLANLVFSNPEIKLLELFSPDNINNCYRYICAKKNIDYRTLIGKNSHTNQDIYVDEKELIKTVDLIDL